jgi:MoaA/NifB/PqqE/SkfB family radical SAM enzyme
VVPPVHRVIDLLSIEITSHCNFCCTFCPDGLMERPRGHMDLALFEKVVREIAGSPQEIPVRQIQFNLMGEPFLNPRLFEMGKIANRHGLRPVIVTNCSLLTEDKVARLLELDLEYLQLSYQTPTPELYKLRKARKGEFAEYRARVLNFLEQKFRIGSPMQVRIHMLDNSKRYLKGFQMVEGVVREEQKRFFEEFARSIRERHGIGPGRGRLDADTAEILPGVQLHFRDCMDWGHAIRPEGVDVVPNERGVCPLPGFQLAVLWNGDTTICCLDYEGRVNLGNVRETSLARIWHGERLRGIQDDIERGVLRERLCQECRGTLHDRAAGAVVPNSDRGVLARTVDFARSYGLRKTLIRGLVELSHLLPAGRRSRGPDPT